MGVEELTSHEALPSCPKCSTGMVLAAVMPHQTAIHMERHTFLCANCNQTRTYMLSKK
jgi:Family of unknown function (DUF6300)